jgi:hypothetical protein
MRVETRSQGANLISYRGSSRRRSRLLLPFPADILVWAFAAALTLVWSWPPAIPDFDSQPASLFRTVRIAGTNGDLHFDLAAPAPGTSATVSAGRRDTSGPRSSRHRVAPQSTGDGRACCRAHAATVKRLGFLVALAGARTGAPAAGHTSLPPPAPRQV